jgi:hypothetical protein
MLQAAAQEMARVWSWPQYGAVDGLRPVRSLAAMSVSAYDLRQVQSETALEAAMRVRVFSSLILAAPDCRFQTVHRQK